MSDIKPITPDEVIEANKENIPDEVIVVFNKLITESWNGHSATIEQKIAIDRIKSIIPEDVEFRTSWLNIESIYTDAGWDVIYDKPGYNEAGEPYFIFKKMA